MLRNIGFCRPTLVPRPLSKAPGTKKGANRHHSDRLLNLLPFHFGHSTANLKVLLASLSAYRPHIRDLLRKQDLKEETNSVIVDPAIGAQLFDLIDRAMAGKKKFNDVNDLLQAIYEKSHKSG